MAWNEPGNGKKDPKDPQDPWSGRDQDKSPPDLDAVIRSLQEKIGGIFGGGGTGGSFGGSTRSIGVIIVVLLVLWCLTGVYKVDAGWRGVITRFGAYTETTMPGLHWHLPTPIEAVTKVNVEEQRFLEVGYRSGGRQGAIGSVPREALMLTEDESIVDVRLAVQYQVKSAEDFLFNVFEPTATLKQVTESAERGVVGQSKINFVLTEGRTQIVGDIQTQIQKLMDAYGAGIQVTSVNLQDAQPPEEVQASFEDAIKAREDKQRYIREAQAYSNDIIPKARGAAARRVLDAEGYMIKVVSEAEGESARFDALLVEYKRAPEVTRKRLYLSAMEEVLSSTETVIIDVKGGNNLLYLPLDRLGSRGRSDSNTTAKPRDSSDDDHFNPTRTRSQSTSNRGSSRGRDGRGRK